MKENPRDIAIATFQSILAIQCHATIFNVTTETPTSLYCTPVLHSVLLRKLPYLSTNATFSVAKETQ